MRRERLNTSPKEQVNVMNLSGKKTHTRRISGECWRRTTTNEV